MYNKLQSLRKLELNEFGKNVYVCETSTTTKKHYISIILKVSSSAFAVHSISPDSNTQINIMHRWK